MIMLLITLWVLVFKFNHDMFTDTIEDMLTAEGDDYYPFTCKFQALAFMLVNSPRPLVRPIIYHLTIHNVYTLLIITLG